MAGALIIIATLSALGSPLGGQQWPLWVLVYWTVVTSWTAALGEEVYFRRFLFERFARLRPLPKLVLTSVAFAVWHVSPVMLPHTFLVGLLFGGIVLVTGRVWPAVLAHAGTNMIGGIGMLLNFW